VSFIGMPGWGYIDGFRRITFTFQFPLVMAFLIMTFVPFFYNTKVVSVYEYLEKRFGPKARTLMAFIFLLSRGLQTAVVLYAPALALSAITGLDPWTTIVIMGVFSAAYTVLGGIAAVIWTDVAQMFVIWLGIFLAIFIPIYSVDGGFGAIMSAASAQNLFVPLNFSSIDQYSFWGGILGSGFLYITYIGTDQSQIQRVLTAKSLRETKLSLSLAGFLVPVQTFLFLLAGICLFSAFGGEKFAKSDQVMLKFITGYLPVGIAGLVAAGVFAAGMSSVDSALNSLATVTVNDFYLKWKPNASDEACFSVSRIATIFWALFTTIFATFMGGLGDVLGIINIIGPLFYPCFLSAFVLAVFCKRGNEKGCLAAIVAGLAIDLYMFRYTGIGSLWYSFLGFVFAFAIGYIVSLLTSKPETAVQNGEFSYEKATGNQLTIHNVMQLAIAGKIKDRDEHGYYVVPGRMDRFCYALIAFFIVQCVILSLI
jgi:SSS family transporter